MVTSISGRYADRPLIRTTHRKTFGFYHGFLGHPTLACRLLLTGDTIAAGTLEHLGIFTELTNDDKVEARAKILDRRSFCAVYGGAI